MPRKKKNDMVVKPIITGIHPQQKRLIKLHLHPDAIKQGLKEIIEVADDEGLKFLFEDCLTLVTWALARLPLVPPTKEKDENEVQHEERPADGEASCTRNDDKGNSGEAEGQPS